MTYGDFLKQVSIVKKGTDWRYGQAYYNTLARHRPDLADKIRKTPLDPFYRDSVDPETDVFVQENW